jgi:hypothetical protein
MEEIAIRNLARNIIAVSNNIVRNYGENGAPDTFSIPNNILNFMKKNNKSNKQKLI